MSSRFSFDHFLDQPCSSFVVAGWDGSVGTAALVERDFDISTRTGFMPPDPPISRLPIEWEPWEIALDQALSMKLQLAVKVDLTGDEIARSASWRERLRYTLPMLSTRRLGASELFLRRAHHVLSFIMHLYVHTLPLSAEIRIPPCVSIPLLEVSAYLQLPPVATHSDTVLYNWTLKHPKDEATPPALDNIRSQDLFTGTNDEQEFYLASSRIEIKGGEALKLMCATTDDMLVGDAIAMRRITGYLHRLASVVDALTHILLDVRKGCDPEVYYHSVRPWLCGEGSDPMNRKWIFEGLDQHPEIEPPTALSGPSAGQSALIHSLDIFLGLDGCSVGEDALHDDRRTLLRRMRNYMPRRHRDFLRRLAASSGSVRNLVIGGEPELSEAYNNAVRSVKLFRDAHIRIVALYIVEPASRERRATKQGDEAGLVEKRLALRGTGGTHLVQFLKGVRDQTAEAIVGAE